MGGSNPQTFPPLPAAMSALDVAKSGLKPQPTQNTIEIHHNLGETHIHDRTAKRKVAVPVAEYVNKVTVFRDDPMNAPVVRFVDNKTKMVAQIWNEIVDTPNGVRVVNYKRVDPVIEDQSLLDLVATLNP
jgi:hypothetical protein